MADASTPIIVAERLTRRYGRRTGVEELSLDVPDGTLFGFLGPNGSGKTTTIRVLLGLLQANGGRARVFGLDCWRDSHRIKADVGYLPGDLRLYPWLNCREAVRIHTLVRGRDLSREALELAEDFSLDPDVRVRSMSRGMRQKLGLILALAHQPRLCILDEPTTSLDPLMQQKLYARLRERVSAGNTVFFSSHTLSEVERLCDRVAILREGRLVAHETLEALRARARRVVTIHWRSSAPLAEIAPPPPNLDLVERKNRRWVAMLTGPVMDLVRWCADKPIDDLAIEHPDLGRLFREYYEEVSEDT
ncbi:MAG: ABC transporter ATP-binding protein [Phycisphaerae bacterium]